MGWRSWSDQGMAIVILFLMVSMFVLSYLAVDMAKECGDLWTIMDHHGPNMLNHHVPCLIKHQHA